MCAIPVSYTHLTLPTPTTSKAPAPEMCMIPSPGDTSAATPLDSVGRGKGCYDSCAEIKSAPSVA